MRVFRARWVRPVAVAAVALAAIGCGASPVNGDDQGGGNGNSIVARFGDVAITEAELDAEVRKRDAKAYQAYYDARKLVLDQMITQRLVDAEVAKRGITENELQAEVIGGATPVTDAEVQAFFTQNQAQMGGRSLEEMSPQIMQYLANQRSSTLMRNYVTNLKKQANVRILLEPPRSEVKIAANDPRKGPEGAPITLVEFSDFQ